MTAERLFSRRVGQLVAVSEPQRETVIAHHHVAPDRIITIPNGVDDPSVDAASARDRKRQELGIPSDAFVVGSVAVLTEQKGMTYLMQAARTIVDRMPSARIVIVGGGPLEEPLKRQAESLGLSGHVLFAGWRADVSELMLAFDVFVMSSLWEAMPLALLEALAAARPIVLTTVGDNRRIVQDGAAGRLVPPRDAGAIASAVLELAGNPAEARDLGERARRRFEQRFRTDRMVQSYERLYSGQGPSDDGSGATY
jgi:glycosyltransferase involved in cell wall biosynthesis